MARTRKIFLAIAAGMTALALPATASAQDAPELPDSSDEISTGTRLPSIVVIGAIRDPNAPKRAEQPADTNVPELPVVYEEDGD